MKRCRHWKGFGAIIALCVTATLPANAQMKPRRQSVIGKGAIVTTHAKGTFDVKVTAAAECAGDAAIGRFLLDKQFHGGLEGTSDGEMLAAGAVAKGSGGYVAMEKVTGRLDGRKGTFVLQHSGTMTAGVPQMTVTVVPDSGTEQLIGIAGTMIIKIDAGKHSYDFAYTLPTK
jgi:Protein of unknown function (DUF3224)